MPRREAIAVTAVNALNAPATTRLGPLPVVSRVSALQVDQTRAHPSVSPVATTETTIVAMTVATEAKPPAINATLNARPAALPSRHPAKRQKTAVCACPS